MAVEIALPTLTTIILTGLVDSINPCAIGVLILLVSTLIANKKDKWQMMRTGCLYVFVVFLTYFMFGLGLTAFISAIPIWVAEYISIAVGLLVVIAGLLEIKDYFWYGEGVSLHIPPKYAKMIQVKMKTLSTGSIIFLGAFVAAVELPCTGGPYLAITLLLSQNFNFTAFVMLIIYNIIFVLPLIVILILVFFGLKVQDVQKWKQSNKSYMRFFTGLLLIGLGWMLMLIANGTINLN